MRKHNFLILALVLLILSSIACLGSTGSKTSPADPAIPASADPLPRGDRILELDANASENGDFDEAIDLARELGAESIRLSVYWDDIEIEPGIYQPDPNWLAIANQYYSAQDLAISLTISVLDTTEIRLPAES